MPPYGSCLLGSINLTQFVKGAFTKNAVFRYEQFSEVVKVFSRMLDNVVEISGLTLKEQRQELEAKRRHGMGFLGLGSTLAMLGIEYGSSEAAQFAERVARHLAIAGWEQALELAWEKGPAPILEQEFEVTGEMIAKRPEMAEHGYKVGDKVLGRILHAHYSRYMQQIAEVDPDLVRKLAEFGARYTHHSSIAPTGTISLSMANNASNGIEPSFQHRYFRNVIREGRNTKEKVEVASYELLAYRAQIDSEATEADMPETCTVTDDVSPAGHVCMQAAVQKWVDSSISKTVNVPQEFPYENFKETYILAQREELKGCTMFRFNPEMFQGVLVREDDLKNTIYRFRLEDGTTMDLAGDEEVEYDGQTHTAANLFDALKEGTYGQAA